MKIFITLLLAAFSITAYAQLLKVDSIQLPYKYLVHIPKEKLDNGKYPLLIFLHGSGERGTDINLVRIHNPITLAPDSLDFPFLLISPQCSSGQRWSVDVLLWMLDEIEKKYPVDKDRIYLTGLSMGGFGVWDLAQKAGDRFAAIAPVCGGGDTANVCMMRHIPVWAFHGDKDESVHISKSQLPIEALKKMGAEAILTTYAGVGHNSWDNAYADPKLYEWLLQHKRMSSPINLNEQEKKQYVGTYLYNAIEKNDTLNTYVSIEKGVLQFFVPRFNFKANMYMVSKDLFRLEGVPFEKDSELFFERNKKNEIIGQRYYPCDNSFVKKIK